LDNSIKTSILKLLPYRDYRISKRFRKSIIKDVSFGNHLISQIIETGEPSLIGRVGVTELQVMRCEIDSSTTQIKKVLPSIIFSKIISKKRKQELLNYTGVYPITREVVNEFFYQHFMAIRDSDLLGVWGETYTSAEAELVDIKNTLVLSQVATCPWVDLDSNTFGNWAQSLSGKKVLIISPFVEEFKTQMNLVDKIFGNVVFPKANFVFCKPPLTQGGLNDGKNWITHLNDTKQVMSKIDFDVALVSAGSYALPLAAYAKEMGKIGINCGGELQLFFGVLGKRWDQGGRHSKYLNEYWIRPFEESKPANWQSIEDGCYW
jgi:hypothetical protein